MLLLLLPLLLLPPLLPLLLLLAPLASSSVWRQRGGAAAAPLAARQVRALRASKHKSPAGRAWPPRKSKVHRSCRTLARGRNELAKGRKYAATPEELERGYITKMRYMQFREQKSSTAELGFRIEAMEVGGTKHKSFTTVRSFASVREQFCLFMHHRPDIVPVFIARLEDFRQALLRSEFFPCHEIVGSSLLFVYGTHIGKGNVWMIDFGKTHRRDTKDPIAHNVEWKAGTNSYEDGYLTGLDNILRVLRDVRDSADLGPCVVIDD